MFRKIVSNLSFSPALVGQLGFYAKRLRKEEATRRIGLIFVALAVAVQCLVVFNPPESANAASDNDLVYGGLGIGADRSIKKFLDPYDANSNHLKDIMNFAGITRQEIKDAEYGSFLTEKAKMSWGHGQKYSEAQGEKKVTVTDDQGNTVTHVYVRPLTLSNGTGVRIYAWIGHSTKVGWFAIMQACGNLVTEKIPPPTEKVDAKPAASVTTTCGSGTVNVSNNRKLDSNEVGTDASFSIKVDGVVKDNVTLKPNQAFTPKTYNFTEDSGNHIIQVYTGTKLLASGTVTSDCIAPPPTTTTTTTTVTTPQPPTPQPPVVTPPTSTPTDADIQLSKTATNISKGSVDAQSVSATEGDQIKYTLTLKNNGETAGATDISDNLSDTLEYSTLLDNSGGTLDPTTKVLTWPSVTLAPGETQIRSFIVRVLDTIPSNAQGTSEPTSYDCSMTNTFGNATNVPITCPPTKVVEQVATELPHTGPTENLLFAGAVLAVVIYFYSRSRQLGKEVRLMRRDLNAGTI